MNKIVLVILSFLLVMTVSIDIAGQHFEDLTDREILIQLIEKFNHLEGAVERIEINSSAITGEIIAFDKKIDRNSIGIANVLIAYEGTIARWNILLALFATFILGIFVWMWRRAYNGKGKLAETDK